LPVSWNFIASGLTADSALIDGEAVSFPPVTAMIGDAVVIGAA
jgi:hypothetical protein